MSRLARLMLNARRRSIDMNINLAILANDNVQLEKLRRQREEVVREIGHIIFQPCVPKALDKIRRSK